MKFPGRLPDQARRDDALAHRAGGRPDRHGLPAGQRVHARVPEGARAPADPGARRTACGRTSARWRCSRPSRVGRWRRRPPRRSTSGSPCSTDLQAAEPVGRLVIDLDRVLAAQPGLVGDLVLRDGDRLRIPKMPQEVTVIGEVQNSTSHLFIPSLTRDDYLRDERRRHQEGGRQAHLRRAGQRQRRCRQRQPLVRVGQRDAGRATRSSCRSMPSA